MNKVNWVVAGIGDIARKRVIPAIQSEPRSRLVGFVTRDAAKTAAYPGTRAWSSVEEAVADPAVDAIYIALPVALHADAAITTLRARKRAVRKTDGYELCRGRAKMVQAEGRASGRISAFRITAVSIRSSFVRSNSSRKARSDGPSSPRPTATVGLKLPGREWLADPALSGGGPLYDIASHRIDAMNFLFGKPERATGLLSNAVHRIAVEDSATVLMQFSGGVNAVIDVRWNSRVARDQFRIIGENGEINLDPLNSPELRLRSELPAVDRTEILPPHANLHFPIVENFVESILANDPARLACPAEQAAWVDWTIEHVVFAHMRDPPDGPPTVFRDSSETNFI